MKSNFVVDVHNHKYGNYQREFDRERDAKEYISSICADLNTYCYLYKLVSIDLEER